MTSPRESTAESKLPLPKFRAVLCALFGLCNPLAKVTRQIQARAQPRANNFFDVGTKLPDGTSKCSVGTFFLLKIALFATCVSSIKDRIPDTARGFIFSVVF